MAITGLSIQSANDFINFLRNAGPTAPTSLSVALFTTAPTDNAGTNAVEVGAGVGYARASLTLGAPASGLASNTNLLDFGTSTAAIGNVPHCAIYDNGGNMRWHGPFQVAGATFNWGSGVQLTVPIGDFDVDLNELITV